MSPWVREAKRFAAVCACIGVLVGPAAAGTTPKPRIAGPDVLTGKPLALAKLGGRPVFVNVWGSWCGGCIAEARLLARFARAHAREVSFLGINTLDSKTGARAFYDRYGTGYPSIFDPRGIIAGAWCRGAPTTLVFDRRHRLVKRIEGSATPAELNAALRRVT